MRIKGFDKNLCCRGMQFEIGKEYKIEIGRKLELCSNTVFHYCDSLQKVHEHYSCKEEQANRFCEIEVLGEEVTDGQKCGSNYIRIVREIEGEELKLLKGLINGNTGLFNTGDMNTGDMNTGDRNTGDMNTGDRNTGDMNTGDMNTGDMNTGDRNTGDRNTGDMNTGDMNTGDMNTGDMNTGDMNTGDMNTGDRNTGDRNTGVFNSCNYSNGVFCNEADMDIRIFNMPSGMSLHDFYISRYWDAICSAPFELTEWVPYTKEEKAEDEKKELIGGYLKKNSYKDTCKKWWSEMSEENRDIIKSMPNFDAEVFKDITGIEV